MILFPPPARPTCRFGLACLILLSVSATDAQIPQSAAQPDAACFASLHQAPVSLSACETALRATPDTIQAAPGLRTARLQSVLAMLHARLQHPARARELMNNALAVAAEDLLISVNNGNLLLREGAYRQALDVYNSVINQLLDRPVANPESAMINAAPVQAVLYRNRSLALRALGRYDEAQRDFQLYLEMTGAIN